MSRSEDELVAEDKRYSADGWLGCTLDDGDDVDVDSYSLNIMVHHLLTSSR